MSCDPGLLHSKLLPLQQVCNRPLLTHTYTRDTQTLKDRSDSVSVGSLDPGAHKILFEPSECLWWEWGLILNAVFSLLLSCWHFSFALGHGVSFLAGSNVLLVVVQQVVILEFLQEKISAHPFSLPSCQKCERMALVPLY